MKVRKYFIPMVETYNNHHMFMAVRFRAPTLKPRKNLEKFMQSQKGKLVFVILQGISILERNCLYLCMYYYHVHLGRPIQERIFSM